MKEKLMKNKAKILQINMVWIFYESFALTGYNINEILYNIVNKIYNLIKDIDENKQYKGITRCISNSSVEIDEVVNLSSFDIVSINNRERNRIRGKLCFC